jgi:hypothetical protein
MNGQDGRINIDVSNYLDLKAKGAARVIKVDGVCHYATKRFDSTTGAAQSMLVPMNRDQVVAARLQQQGTLDALDAVLADIDAAKEV